MKIDQFVIAIIITIIIAYIFPSIQDYIPLSSISSIGVAVIFLFYGLKLKIQDIKSGLSNWKLHLCVHGTTFLLFPILVYLLRPLLLDYNELWISLFFLGAIPSTVSSSVVMVNMAKGNVPAAIFNASISGIIGLIITPILMSMVNIGSEINGDMSDIYLKLFLEIILPLTIGLLLQKKYHSWALKHIQKLNLFDKIIILIIIYNSFASSFSNNTFDSVSIQYLLVLSIIVIGLFFLVFYLTSWIGQWLGFTKEDIIVLQYCGTKKSLVHATVFSKAIFPANLISIMLLPIMIYHAWQIFFISVHAGKIKNATN